MADNERARSIALLEDVERQFKLAVALRVACSGRPENLLGYAAQWTFGRHIAGHEELRLTSGEEERAAAALSHSATYLMAVQMDSALQAFVPDRFRHPDPDLRAACWVARLIRNAFAHQPLSPTWLTYPECDNTVFRVAGIITLDTTGLNGQRVRRMDYGGPLALLRLSAYVRSQVLCEQTC